jgi:hypothetical protein
LINLNKSPEPVPAGAQLGAPDAVETCIKELKNILLFNTWEYFTRNSAPLRYNRNAVHTAPATTQQLGTR